MLDQLSSGVTGLIVGAVLGLVSAVFVEDYLKERRTKLLFRLRRVLTKGDLPTPNAEFRIGPLHTPVVIVEGDGEQVINQQSVRIVIDPVDVELPEEVAGWRDEIQAEQDRKRAAGEQFFWNGPRYAVSDLTISRTAIEESPEVCLRLKHADYYAFLAAQQLDRPLADGSTLRTRYLDRANPQNVPDFLCCSFGCGVAVVTADNLVVIQRRSRTVGSQPGTWSASANEALSRGLDSSGRSAPDLYEVMRRGIAEELSIDKAEYRLEMTAFAVDVERQQWGALFVAFLHDLTGEDLLERRSRGVPDKWEHDEVLLERFDVAPVVARLLDPDHLENWSSVAPPLFYLALIRRFGRARVERATARLLRSGGRARDPG